MNQYKEIKEILCKYCGEENVISDAPMKEHTHFRVGGPVDLLVTPSTKEQVGEVISVCKDRNVPYFILGNGSNILVKDGGISGVVIKLEKIDNIESCQELAGILGSCCRLWSFIIKGFKGSFRRKINRIRVCLWYTWKYRWSCIHECRGIQW